MKLPVMTLALAAGIGFGIPAMAAELPKLHLPVDCTLGETCWVIQYPDMDPSDKAIDGAGLDRTYNTHKGVDIGIADLPTMNKGVAVLAPADGKVLRARDEMPDVLVIDNAKREAVEDRECGNGMVIDHGNGLETQLCHMKLNSIIVKPGDMVKTGDKLGLVGASGLAAFPHLHVTTRLNGVVVDPTSGKAMLPDEAAKISTSGSLWAEPELGTYDPFDIVQIGFNTGAIKIETALAGDAYAEQVPTDPPALVVWGVLYGVRAGDRLTMTILDPEGAPFFENTKTLDATKIRYYQFGGKKVRQPLPPGIYTGRVRIERDTDSGTIQETRQTTIKVGD